MKNGYIILCFFLANSICSAHGVDVNYIIGSPKPSFSYALMGVKSYDFECVSNGQQIDGQGQFIDAYFLKEMKTWCEETLPDAMFGTDYNYPSSTHMHMVAIYSHSAQLSWSGTWQWYVSNIAIRCYLGTTDAYAYEFLLPNFKVIGNDYSAHTLYKALKKSLDQYVRNFSDSHVLRLPKYQTSWTESSLKDYCASNADAVEGIYESAAFGNGERDSKYKLGLKKLKDGNYALIYLDGANLFDDWAEGEVKAFLTSTGTYGMYKAEWIMLNKEINNDFYISLTAGAMHVRDEDTTETYIKLFPTIEMEEKSMATSGTGFFITRDGYIVTNYHVIENARDGNIKVSGIDEDYSKSYKAQVEISDKQNDLAILRIVDSAYTPIANIPYAFRFTTSDVGEDCFVLGYPLISTMGKEIKLTNGIISSKTGYESSIAQYQISAPVQPGNSGGPLFDKSGNVIGIVQAKHTEAENAGYAIKASYMKNLVELLPVSIKFPQVNQLNGKPLPKQVELASKAVCLIIVNGD